MKTALRAVLSFAALAAASGCQVYDFEPVTPLAIAQTTQTKNVTAKQLKPNLMILLDKSGSMSQALNSACCTQGFPNCNETTCPTRMGAARRAMDSFLSMNGSIARMGLTIYPHNDTPGSAVCTAAGAPDVLVPINPASDDVPDLQSWADGINMQLQLPCNTTPAPATCPLGGTPTGGSLGFLAGMSELHDPNRDDFVLLITDGLPNCNSANPNTCANPTACKCTLINPTNGTPQCAPMPNDAAFCVRGCLDQDGSVEAIRNLRMAPGGGVKTIVVGFGSDFGSGDGFDVLNAMAIAGGFQRTCPMGTDAECGTGGRCLNVMGSNPTCQTAFYSASNQAELIAALSAISASLGAGTVCRYTLDATPSSDDLVSVMIDGVPTQPGPDTWNLTNGQIVFPDTGPQSICAKLLMATPQAPIKLEIRIIEAL